MYENAGKYFTIFELIQLAIQTSINLKKESYQQGICFEISQLGIRGNECNATPQQPIHNQPLW